jgi:NAD(P)-dependent dehydrogenase (short-subunit alcohol dehydrogenase family)
MLGRAVCETLAARGARIGISYFRGADVATGLTQRLPNVTARQVDLTSVPDLDRACDELANDLGGVDALIHTAGIGTVRDPGGFDKILDIDEPGWDRLMAVNVRSAFFAIKRLLEPLTEARGNIVLMGSVDGLRSVPAPVHYGSSKGALRSMVLALSKELGPSGIKVNMVAPGLLEGGLSRLMPDDLRAEFFKHCGLRRTGRMAEIAEIIAHLALENTYMTGQAIMIDGAL